MDDDEREERVFEVDRFGVGMRVDKYLAQQVDDLSRSRIQGLIDSGDVRLNHATLKSSSTKLELNDILSLVVPEPEPCEPLAEDIPLDVIFEDENLLVVNKPVGMVVHPGAGNWSGTLVNALLHHCGGSLSGIGGVIRPGIVHRLDKDTSGLMLVAKTDQAHRYLAAQLEDRTLHRLYHALVLGVPVPVKGVVDRPIGRHRHDRMKMSVMSNAPREARTHYHVLRSFGTACALVECRLDTGRTHQIRVHMEALGHPILGDQLYKAQPTAVVSALKKNGYHNDFIKKIIETNRQILHAQEISFVHPITEEDMHFRVDPPEDMQSILLILNNKN